VEKMIVSISKSPVKHKRFRILFRHRDGKEQNFDFGLDTGTTYIDGASAIQRDNYWKRHTANPTEKKLIENLDASPALFSSMILWGKSRDINQNIKTLNAMWKH
jgi:hypothetical protein